VSEIADLTAALVQIDSVNPALVPGAAGESAIARFVAAWLSDAGLEVETVERDGRPSVIGTARGRNGGRSLLLNAHLDTVGVETMARPFDAYVEDGRLHGRGSYDMKGALAAALLATRDAATLGLAGDVVITAVADEELGSAGTESVLERIQADAAIVCEPTELRVAVAHRGFAGFEIETHGVAAHGSMPHLGVDAIEKMGPILVALGALNRELGSRPKHPLLATPSLHASLIEGGQEMSSYPARCVLVGERRTLPGETDADIERELRAIAGEADARLLVSRGPFAIDSGHELVQTLLAVTGESEVVGLPFWTDAGLTAAAGIPTVLFGPAGAGAHAAEEWVEIASLERCREVYVAAARALCGDRLTRL
jgi:acetylornithine deacetylase